MSAPGSRKLPWVLAQIANSSRSTGVSAAASSRKRTSSTQSAYAQGSPQNPISLSDAEDAEGAEDAGPSNVSKPNTKRRRKDTRQPVVAPPPPVGLHATGLHPTDFSAGYLDLTQLDGDEYLDDIVDLTQSDDRDETVFIGSFRASAVGVRYYSGVATLGEQVLLRREPHNKYDSNAIQVLSVVREQIGHLPRDKAARLSPLLDARKIHLEAVVTAEKGAFELPLMIDVYTSIEDEAAQDTIILDLARGGIHFTPDSNKRRSELRSMKKMLREGTNLNRGFPVNFDPEAGLSQRPNGVLDPLGFQNQVSYHHNYPWLDPHTQNILPYYQYEDLMNESQRFTGRDMGNAVEKFGLSEEELEKLPKAAQPKGLSIELLPYQLQGLHWLIEHENPVFPENPNDSIQFWKRSPIHHGYYINTATRFSQKEIPHLASGGILADDMGLGKTVQMISLILADVEKAGKVKSTECGTLIVAPLSVMSNWEQQIRSHIEPERALKVYRYHGSGKGKKRMDLNSFDVVVTSYGTLTSEFDAHTKNKKSGSIFNKKWRRIVLDEAHQIRNPNTKASLASVAVQATHRWALTGTPIVNNLKDLFSLIRFLGFSGGLAELPIFSRLFIRPLNEGDREGTKRLQAVMGSICLRRKKDMKFVNLDIPELKEYIHKVKFTQEEQERYNVLESEAKGLLEYYERSRQSARSSARQSAGAILHGPQEAALPQASASSPAADASENRRENAYNNLLERLLRMRQMCNHSQLCGTARVQAIEARLGEIANNGMSEERKQLLQEMLQLAIDSQEDCPICLETLHNPRITVCKHVFGLECISRVIDAQHKCPMCRHELPDITSANLVEPSPETTPTVILPEALEDGTALPPLSSKMSALITILQATRQNDPTSKTIIFSQWTKFLDLTAPHLTFAGFRFCRIDGTMSVHNRDRAIARLSLPDEDPDAVDVMLASLGVASVGLNLVAANQVILADSWWAPAIEDQAVDRVHRLGQKRETTVWRLVVEDSIEQRVLQVQENKRKLVGQAFMDDEGEDGEGPAKGKKRQGRGKGRETRLADLQMLLRGGSGNDNGTAGPAGPAQ